MIILSFSAETLKLLRRGFSSRSGVSLDRLLEGADRIRAEHPLPAWSSTAAEMIREDRDR